MISHRYRCIFIHIPKCGGTSIETALGHRTEGSRIRGTQDHRSIRMLQKPIPIRAFTTKDNQLELVRRLRSSIFQWSGQANITSVSAHEYDSYFKFSFVRNPWARVYSWYKNVQRDESHRKSLKLCSGFSLDEFLDSQLGKGMLKPQLYWLRDFSNGLSLDYLGRFESLPSDFEIVASQLGLPTSTLPHQLKARDVSTHMSEMNRRNRDRIQECFSEEIDLFGYRFETCV